MSEVKVIIADDHTLMRHGIKNILIDRSDIKVIDESRAADETITKVLTQKPDVLFLDLGFPEKSGIEVIYALKEQKSPTKIIVLTRHDDETMLLQALMAGADAYILKNFTPEALIEALRSVQAGKMVLPERFEHLREDIEKKRTKPTKKSILVGDPLQKLSKRERQIFFLLANGLPNRIIAKQLEISPRTVETHRARVIKKLDFDSSADLIRYAIKHNLLTP